MFMMAGFIMSAGRKFVSIEYVTTNVTTNASKFSERVPVNVLFECPTCQAPARVLLDSASDWQCPHCDHRQHFEPADPSLSACAACGNHELYKQKDFPHRLGLFVLIAGFAASIYTYLWYEKWLTYAILV